MRLIAAPTGPRGLPADLRTPGRCLVMGILNVTPDSFSDGGRWATPGAAVAHGLRLARDGADIVDVGGESTRPGALRVSPQEECDRVLPVVAALAQEGVVVSIDTMRAETAQEAISAGAVIVNDVSGGRSDPRMYEAVARRDAAYVIMHWRAHAAEMQQWAHYSADAAGDVIEELAACREAAIAAGIEPDRIVVDPGLGFAKEAVHNWQLIRAMDRLRALGAPVLVGASRKRFLGELLAADGEPRAVADREAATTAITTLVAAAGAWCVRVHDVAASGDAVRVVAELMRARAGLPEQ